MTRPWDDLLSGEELAFRTTEPPRPGRVEPLPEGLDAGVARRLRRAERELLTREQVVPGAGHASGSRYGANVFS